MRILSNFVRVVDEAALIFHSHQLQWSWEAIRDGLLCVTFD